MGSLFEIHRSNLEWLKSYVCPDGFKLDSDRYQIGVSFELCHEHFDTFRAYAHAMEIMTHTTVWSTCYWLKIWTRSMSGTTTNSSARKAELSPYTPILPAFCEKVPFSNICDYFRKPVYRRSAHV